MDMDRLNRRLQTLRIDLSEFTSEGLILWRLAIAERPDLWCFVFEHPEGFWMVLDDHPEGTKTCRIRERHTDIVSVVHRAEALKHSLLRCGWTEIEVE